MVSTHHPDVTTIAPQWRRCRDVFAGRDALLAAATEYLPWPQGMDAHDYRAYLLRAMPVGAFQRTVHALAGALLRRPPRQTNMPPAIATHLEDVDFEDQALPAFAQNLAHELLAVGRAGVLLDMPDAPLEGAPLRPYWIAYRAEDIINWRTERRGNDPAVLTSLVLREHVHTSKLGDAFGHVIIERYRECSLDEAGRYQVRIWTPTAPEHLRAGESKEHYTAGEWATPTRRGAPLTFIPFCFFGTTGIAPSVSRPPLLDLADVSLSHYRNSADREHGLFYTALPTPWVAGAVSGAGESVLRIGSGAAWHLTENGKAGMLEFSGQGLAAIEKAMKEKESLMAALGARMLDAPNVGGVTATAVMSRNAAEAASLRSIASAISSGLTALVRWHAWWALAPDPYDETIRVDLADDLDRLRLTAADIQAAISAVQSDLMSFDSFYALLETAGWTRPGATAADERHAVMAGMRLLAPQQRDDDDNDDDDD